MKSNKARAAFFLLILIGVIVAIRAGGLTEYLDQQRLHEVIGRWGIWGPLIYILIFAVAPALFLPGLPITVAGGLAFGPVWGTIYASIGSTLGAGLAFLVSRYFARGAVSEMLGERWKKIDEGVARKGWVYVAITRLIPIFPFNLLNYAFGLTRIGFIPYLFTSWLFMLPGTAAYVIFSSSLLDLLKGQISPALLLGLLLIALVSLAPLFYRRWKGAGGVLSVWIVLFLGYSLFQPPAVMAGGEEVLRLIRDHRSENDWPEGWRGLTFQKISEHTEYALIEEEGRPIIRAVSRHAASGLYRPLDLDPKVFSVLSWCWKIGRIISKGDETRKEGDDYAARIYVTFKYDPDNAAFWERTKFGLIKAIYGEYPPKGAINYIWANRLPKGRTIPNAYTDRAQMVAVQSGEEKVGEWLCEERNLYSDYQRLFGEKPPAISGVAVMTDTDNTGEEAVAYYSDIVLRAAEEGK
ncbi:MAG: DUF3047 domain-containing protein [Candidatus Manganitrophus sp. SA1]|nr:DUF3047 domain-containing protein [Candidatus Manganitrophus morganii]